MPFKPPTGKAAQLVIGLIIGLCFGFLLQRGGVTRYEVIINQLRLSDFTVVKIMVTAMIVGLLGVHLLAAGGLARLQPKPGSLGATLVGSLIFGVGFALLGYCPGTVAGAAGQGSLDALLGGVPGIILGAGLFAAFYPRLRHGILVKGHFGDVTLPQVLKVNHWAVVVPAALVLIALLFMLERLGY